MRTRGLALALVLVAAAALRFWSISAKLPFGVGPDEPEVMTRVLRILRTGDFNPHFFDYPSLYIYVQTAVAILRFLAGALGGAWHSLNDVTVGDFYLWARLLTATLGTATVWLIYAVGARWGTRHALLAAGLLAVFPNHVRESHYALTDVPVTLLTTLTLLLTFRAQEKPAVRAWAWAGVAAGLAGATKYNGFIAVLMPLAALAFTATRGPKIGAALAVVGAAAGAFLVCAPYTLADLPSFLNAFGYMTLSVGPVASRYDIALLYGKHLLGAIGWFGAVVLAGGIGLGVARLITGPGRERFAPVLVFLAAYAWVITGRSLVFARYMLPLVPMVSLVIAIAVVSGVTLLRRFAISRAVRTALIVALTAGVLANPAWNAIGYDLAEGRESTTEIVYTWIQANAPAGSKLGLENGTPWFSDRRYRTEMLGLVSSQTAESYRANGFDYLIISSDNYGRYAPGSTQREAYQRILSAMPVAFTARPSGDHPGPELLVLKVPR